MKIKLVLALLFVGVFSLMCFTACTSDDVARLELIPNPWTDCLNDFQCASKIAGFSLPLNIDKCTLRATKGMIEITYPIDSKRFVTLRKSDTELNGGDISGDYNVYSDIEHIQLYDSVPVTLRKKDGLIYVMFFVAETGYYSVSCKDGMTMKDIYNIYDMLAKFEVPKLPMDAD